MNITIDLDDPKPIFTQLIEQIKQAVVKDLLQPGDPLPSIRQLANDLEINSKTVSKAYKLLERDAVIQSKGYRGTFVHPDAKSNCHVDLSHWVNQQFAELIIRMKAAGVTDSEMRITFNSILTNN
ncbi:GntR family transcriptional regulator [Paraglaciecola sp. L3A3]|uniref:GntR family transcriptional regulator n=1 Tax=Paraglaciecola sp. L3A3 TaxID=2686358 RepID=UPI00131DDECE|nr:GntR family transcriptional regulator [Paraglaciecola sp. L3A3]